MGRSSLDSGRSLIPLDHEELDEAEQHRLVREAQAGNLANRERLILHSQRLVHKVARRYRFSGYPLEDLAGWGNIGLIRAVGRCDLDSYPSFPLYAARSISNSIRDHLFDHPRWISKYIKEYFRLHRFSDLGHEEIVASLGMRDGSRASLEAALRRMETNRFHLSWHDRVEPPDGSRDRADEWECYLMLSGRLDPQFRDYVHLQYLEGWTQDQIAHKYGCSRQNVSHHVRSAVAQLAALAQGEV